MFWELPKTTNAWETATERFEEVIIIGKTYLFEVVISVIVIVPI